MLSARRTLTLALGLTLGLTFFGCVGLPRRRPPARPSAPPHQPVAPLPTPATPPALTTPAPTAVPRVAPPPTEDPLRIPVETPPQTPTAPPVAPPGGAARTTVAPEVPPTTPPAEVATTAPIPPTAPPPEVSPTPVAPTLVSPTPAPTPPSQPVTRGVAPAPQAEPLDNLAELKRLHTQAARVTAGLDSYIVRLTRTEVLKGKQQPQEVILVKFRRQPFSIHFKWLGEVAHGREALHVQGQHRNEVHTRLAAGDVPFAPAGKRMSFPLDSPLIRSASRHPITNAGFGRLVDQLGMMLTAMEKNDRSRGTATYLPQVRLPEFSTPVEAVEWKLPPGYDASLPKGGTRWMYFDPKHQLPMLVVTHDERGQQVERYHYDRLQHPVKLDDDDFDPDRLWPTQARSQRR